MVTAVSLGLIAVLGLGGFLLSKKGVIGGALSPLSTPSSQTTSENDKKLFSDIYQDNAVLDSTSSSQPFISSNELSRPHGLTDSSSSEEESEDSSSMSETVDNALSSGGSPNNNNNGRKNRIRSILGLGGLSFGTGYIVGSGEEGVKKFSWGLFFGILLGGYVLYKVTE